MFMVGWFIKTITSIFLLGLRERLSVGGKGEGKERKEKEKKKEKVYV